MITTAFVFVSRVGFLGITGVLQRPIGSGKLAAIPCDKHFMIFTAINVRIYTTDRAMGP